jgi:hypothetical protein
MWTLAKGRRTAVCELWTNLLGWELKLASGATLLQSQVCRTQDDVLDAHEAWKVAMRSKGGSVPSLVEIRWRNQLLNG